MNVDPESEPSPDRELAESLPAAPARPARRNLPRPAPPQEPDEGKDGGADAAPNSRADVAPNGRPEDALNGRTDAGPAHASRADGSLAEGGRAEGVRPEGRPEVQQHVVVISGLSGAGKTAATKLFEDLGYICMDNVPGELLPELAELVSRDRHRFEKVAIVLDVRAGDAPLALAAMRGALEGRGIKPTVFFLEARDEILIRRFSETRHRHPVAGRRGISGSIAMERRLLESVRADADVVIDTSDLSLRQLKERLFAHLEDSPEQQEGMLFQLISFGFKYGVPLEADLVFDVRFMENPYYVDELRHLSGLTPAVRDYVMAQPITSQFLEALGSFLDLTVPGFISEGKTRLTIAIGCTGGYHRSIVIAEELRGWLEQRGYGRVAVFHRELERT